MEAAPTTADPSSRQPHIRVPPTLRSRMARNDVQEFVAAKKVAKVTQTDTPLNASTFKTSPNQGATSGLANLRNSNEVSRAAHLRILTTPAMFGS